MLIEPINNRDIPGYLMNDFDLAEQIIAELKLPNLRFQFDIYHRQIIHGDVMHGLEQLMPIIDHMQIASVPARHEPTTGELDDARCCAPSMPWAIPAISAANTSPRQRPSRAWPG